MSGAPDTQPDADTDKDATENDGTHKWEPVNKASSREHPRDSDRHLDHATSNSAMARDGKVKGQTTHRTDVSDDTSAGPAALGVTVHDAASMGSTTNDTASKFGKGWKNNGWGAGGHTIGGGPLDIANKPHKERNTY